MKRVWLVLALSMAGLSYGQDQFFRTDVGIGSAMTFSKIRTFGISASTEPKFFFNEQFGVGMRLEGDVLFGGKIMGESEDISVGMSSRVAILGKGEYYIGTNNTRPFFGFMAGYYTQANMSAGGTGTASVAASRGFGMAPEIGITFGNFRISGMYHFVPGQDIVAINAGETVNVSRSYAVIQLGFRGLGINDK